MLCYAVYLSLIHIYQYHFYAMGSGWDTLEKADGKKIFVWHLNGMENLSLIHISLFSLSARSSKLLMSFGLPSGTASVTLFSSRSIRVPPSSSSRPVSYTHLDVYKRQMQKRTRWQRWD